MLPLKLLEFVDLPFVIFSFVILISCRMFWKAGRLQIAYNILQCYVNKDHILYAEMSACVIFK